MARPRDIDRWKGDRKSTRLNSSHSQISYAVFCLKKKNEWTVRLSTYHEIKLNFENLLNRLTSSLTNSRLSSEKLEDHKSFAIQHPTSPTPSRLGLYCSNGRVFPLSKNQRQCSCDLERALFLNHKATAPPYHQHRHGGGDGDGISVD